jgi:hypothetical protein
MLFIADGQPSTWAEPEESQSGIRVVDLQRKRELTPASRNGSSLEVAPKPAMAS